MKNHDWSIGIAVYESIGKFKCRDCLAEISSEEDFPTFDDLVNAKLPMDCEEAVLTVIHEEYISAVDLDSWEDDVQYEWDSPHESTKSPQQA